MNKRIVKTTILSSFFILAVFLVFYSPVIFQEGNPLPVAYGIIKLSTTKERFIKLDEHKYIFRSNTEDLKALTDYLAQNGLEFIDRAGSGFLFRDKSGKTHTALTRMYSGQFEILDFSK
jgi:hypothetical protein